MGSVLSSRDTNIDAGTILSVRALRKSYGQGLDAALAIDGLSFSVAQGEFVSIVGPSGCGKTTLLRCLAGLLEFDSGVACLHGATIDGPPENLSVVFQDYSRSLLPWLSVSSNVVLPLRRRFSEKRKCRELADDALNAVGLKDCADRYPWQLSGGMQQRVAIARALAYQPELLLMDEPFASVDAQTRADLEDLVLRVRRQFGVTVLFVTHDIDESVYLSDRVIALGGPPAAARGVVQIDLPEARDQLRTKSLPRFAELRSQVLGLVRDLP